MCPGAVYEQRVLMGYTVCKNCSTSSEPRNDFERLLIAESFHFDSCSLQTTKEAYRRRLQYHNLPHSQNEYHKRTDNPAICQPNTPNESEQPSHSVNTDLHTNTSQHKIQTDFKFDHRGIHIVNVNIRHLKPKLDQIKTMLQGSVIDIFGICETFLSHTDDDTVIS